MKLVHVVPSIDRSVGGPAVSVPALCDSLARAGADVVLHTLAGTPVRDNFRFRLVQHRPWRFGRRMGICPAMRAALNREAADTGVLHSHGLWLLPNFYAYLAARGTNCRLVVSPRGMLSQWALRKSRWRKKIMWWAGQGKALARAACIHATADSEQDEIRAAGLKAPIAVIPNGIEVPDAGQLGGPRLGRRMLLFLSRIHQKKGLDNLLRSWRQVQNRAADWDLCIVGPDEGGYLGQLQALARDLGAERVFFDGPVFGEQKQDLLRQASMFVLPTHSENFGMAVAEALAWGVPAIVSKGAPWAGLEQNGCGWWIDIGAGPLKECLESALALPRPTLAAMGARGREWMAADYSWDQMAKMMHTVYLWLLGGGQMPPWVSTN